MKKITQDPQMKQLVRKVASVQKTADLIYDQGDIQEDILLQLTELKNAVKYLSDRVTKLETGIRNEVQASQFAIEDRMDKLTDDTVIVVKKDGLWKKIKNLVKKGN